MSASEPRVLTACAAAVYTFAFFLGLYINLNFSAIEDRWVGVFWALSGVLMLSFAPLAIVGAWRGLWMIERPALLGVSLGVILASSISFFDHYDEGPAGAIHLATIVLSVAVLITRWSRISSSYVDPIKRVNYRTP